MGDADRILFKVRNAISIIPQVSDPTTIYAIHTNSSQEPQLFQGTIRDNIDPSESYDDLAVWGALEKAS